MHSMHSTVFKDNALVRIASDSDAIAALNVQRQSANKINTNSKAVREI
jgi:hypothetical protein